MLKGGAAISFGVVLNISQNGAHNINSQFPPFKRVSQMFYPRKFYPVLKGGGGVQKNSDPQLSHF